MTSSKQNGNVMPGILAHYEGKQSSKSRSKSTPDDWCCLISQNHILPALFDHDFGGNRERGCTWCLSIWSHSYHQFQLGLLKYILTSLFHYHSAPCHFLEWLDKQSSPDVPSIDQPGGSSRSCPPFNEYDSPDGGHTKGGRRRKCASQTIAIDSRSKLQKFSDWLKTHPSARDNKTASRDLFSRVSFEKAACIVNGFLECQSNCSIPSLLYWAGLTAVIKIQGQDFPGLCLLSILSMGGMIGLQYVELERDLILLLWLGISINDNLSQKQGVHCQLSVNSKWAHCLVSVSYCD